MTITLTYWNVRGLGEPIRHLLKYKEVDFVDDRIEPSGPGWGRWVGLRDNTEGLELANLPFIDDNGTKVTQSIAVLRYLGRKFDLFPTLPEEIVLSEMLEQEIFDLRNRLTSACYDPYLVFIPGSPKSETGSFDHPYLKEKVVANRLKERLPKINRLLTKKFAVKDEPTYVDFMLYEYLDQLKRFVPECFAEEVDNILCYMTRFENLPHLKEWFQSDEYKEGQYINAPMAVWNGKK